jgi:hypothetical protein
MDEVSFDNPNFKSKSMPLKADQLIGSSSLPTNAYINMILNRMEFII